MSHIGRSEKSKWPIYFKKYSVPKERQIKTALRVFYPVRIGHHQENKKSRMSEGVWGKQEPMHCYWGCKLVKLL